MGGKLLAFFRWLFRLDRQQDPLLERYLRKNREALDRQRREPAKSSLGDHEDRMKETLREEPGEKLGQFPMQVEEPRADTLSSSQRNLPLKYENASAPCETNELDMQDSSEGRPKQS
jgi:hypothetical protein